MSGVSVFVPYGADQMYAYATGRTDAANNFILQLGSLAENLTPPVITPTFPSVGAAPTPITTAAPDMQDVVWVAPGLPSAFGGDLAIDQYLPAPFDATPPTLVFGTAPSPLPDTALDAPAVDLSFTMPSLSVTLPAAPSMLSLNIVPFDGVVMPTVDESTPELVAVEPVLREYIQGDLYTSSLLTALKLSLEERITSGGTGLAAGVETAIWDRGREREARQAADAIRELERMESMGFAFPPGVYLDARLRVTTETAYANAGHSREVMIEAARLEQTNVLKALETSTSLEGKLIDYSNAVEQRIFESCKYATQAGVEIYNAKVRAYAAFLDAYKTKVAIYEARVRGEVAKVEAYKATVQAEEAKAQINTALVQQYKVQVEAALSNIEVYKAEIAGIQTKAEIEKLKVMIFGEQVRAYATRVTAYTSNVEAFRATLQAEGTKQEAFKTQVQAYGAQVEAATKTISARIEEYKARVMAKGQEWDGYKAQVQGEASRAQAIASSNSSLADAYKAEVMGWSSYNDVLVKEWQASLEQAQRVAEIGVSAAKANGDLYMASRGIATDAAKVGAQVSAQLGAAALNAINWSSSFNNSASVSASTSNSVSHVYQESQSNSQTNSTSSSTAEIHNFNQST